MKNLMGRGALDALKASIKHWEENVTAIDPGKVSTGSGACALCDTFQDIPGRTQCEGCPVFNNTGRPACIDTPYGDATNLFFIWSCNSTPENYNLWQTAAMAEVDYLKSLLPHGPFLGESLNTLHASWLELKMAKLFGKKIVGHDGHFTVHMRRYKGKIYLIDFEEEEKMTLCHECKYFKAGEDADAGTCRIKLPSFIEINVTSTLRPCLAMDGCDLGREKEDG